jgi:hypothetical protein
MEMAEFSGLGLHLGNLSRLSRARTRSISPENFTGEKGIGGMSIDGPAANAARGLGQGWKVSPYIVLEPGETRDLADIEGSGAIQSIWMTLAGGKWRHAILRAYWDDQEQPSIECPPGTSSPMAGRASPRSPRCRSASIRAGRSTATGRCRSARGRASP